MPIPIYQPYLPKHALKYAHDALDSTWISSHGKYIDMVQERLQELLGVKHVILTANGTCACHLMAKALRRRIGGYGKKDALVPSNSYVAVWNSLLFDKEFRLITVKTDLDTWNIDLADLDDKLDRFPNASVEIVPNMGGVINTPALKLKYPNTTFIEDSCEAIFGTYNDRMVGSAGLVSAFSGFANKTITGGEFAFAATSSDDAYEYMELVSNQGQSERRFVHSTIGVNYRCTNVVAAIVFGQLEVLSEILEKKANLFDRYRAAFRDSKRRKNTADWRRNDGCQLDFALRIVGSPGYDQVEKFLEGRGIQARPMFYPITAHKYLVDNDDVLIDRDDVAVQLNKEIVALPSYPDLKEDEQGYIISCIEGYLKEIKQCQKLV